MATDIKFERSRVSYENLLSEFVSMNCTVSTANEISVIDAFGEDELLVY